MTVIVDTLALFALGNRDDPNHERALAAMHALEATSEQLAMINYAVPELVSLLARRAGMAAVRRAHSIIERYTVLWTDPLEHASGMQAFLHSGRGWSFVDCTTVEVMRARGLDDIFTFDSDFARAGLNVIPG